MSFMGEGDAEAQEGMVCSACCTNGLGGVLC